MSSVLTCMQEIYNYAYNFACEKGQKCLQLDMAIGMWQLLFADRPWPLLEQWCTFLQQNHKRAISRDTWVQLLEFISVSPCWSKKLVWLQVYIDAQCDPAVELIQLPCIFSMYHSQVGSSSDS